MTTNQGFSEVCYSDILFEDLEDNDKMYETIYDRIRKIVNMKKTCLEVRDNPFNDLNLFMPKPFVTVCTILAASQGWNPEAIAQGLGALTGWLERGNEDFSDRGRKAKTQAHLALLLWGSTISQEVKPTHMADRNPFGP